MRQSMVSRGRGRRGRQLGMGKRDEEDWEIWEEKMRKRKKAMKSESHLKLMSKAVASARQKLQLKEWCYMLRHISGW